MRASTAIALLTTCVWAARAADDPEIKSVFVRDSEIYVAGSATAPLLQLTHDGLPKSLAVWSPDGHRIAFVRDSGGRALAGIVIISSAGKPLQEISFRPVGSNVSGMRFVEEIQWISGQRIAVSGSVNPSTCEYVMIDPGSGKEVDWYAADGFSLVPSPHGTHVAYLGAVPHFTPEADRRPRLCVDHKCDSGYPGPSRHVEFLTYPVWSASGSSVAIVGQDYQTRKVSLVVKPLEANPSEYALTSAPSSGTEISWARETVFVGTEHGAWKLEPKGSALIRIEPGAVPSDLVVARQMKLAERARLQLGVAIQLDCWCASCALRSLPRRQGPLEARPDR
jgi:dipeptidyl aminopeptidase/acylaminoacyl peptidase